MNPDADKPQRPNLLLRLAHWLGFGQQRILYEVAQALVALQDNVIDLAGGLETSAANSQETLTALQEALAQLEKKTSRVGRELFKANAVNEATQQRIQAALARLHEAEAHRDKELAALRERLARQQAGERLKVVERLFPVLDGLHEALLSGKNTLDQMAAAEEAARPISSFSARLQAAWQALSGHAPAESRAQTTNEQRETLAAWLAGVEFVYDRLAAVLEHEAVSPIESVGQPFDPNRHMVVEVVPTTNGVAPGQVVRELRRGYAMGDTVLRYAEVVVARDLKPSALTTQTSDVADAVSSQQGGAHGDAPP